MARATVTVEGFVAVELVVRDARGKDVVDVTVAVTPQKFDEGLGKWQNTGPSVWWRASFWEEHAKRVLDTLHKGSLVTISGTGVKVNPYLSQEGHPGASLEIVNPTIAKVIQRPKRGATQQSGASDDGWFPGEPPADDDQRY